MGGVDTKERTDMICKCEEGWRLGNRPERLSWAAKLPGNATHDVG